MYAFLYFTSLKLTNMVIPSIQKNNPKKKGKKKPNPNNGQGGKPPTTYTQIGGNTCVGNQKQNDGNNNG
jgi:hypothetical protein